MSAPSPGKTSQPPKLVHLALNALCRNWSSATALDGLSTDLAKLVWAHVKDHHARQGITPVPCAAMYPLVRASWQIQTLDLSESRVSQMHSSILARLKAQMQHREKEF